MVSKTKPLSGRLELTDGEVGLFPLASAFSGTQLRRDRALAAADFSFYARAVQASFAFTEVGFDLALTGGTLGLPAVFTTLAAGECQTPTGALNGGEVPSVQLSPASALTMHHDFGSSVESSTLRYEGALECSNLGFSLPSSPGQPSPAALRLCSAKLVFRGPDLPAFENLSGQLQVHDLGSFRLLSGRLDPRGEFDLSAAGEAVLSGSKLTIQSLVASFAGGRFQLSSSATAEIGGGLRLEPDDRTAPAEPTPSVLSVGFDSSSGRYILALAG